MKLTTQEIAQMIDLSCVRTTSCKSDIEEMIAAARKYQFGQVSVLQCFIPYTRHLLQGTENIHVVGNVSFPSGSDSTTVKVAQAKEMAAAGCDEIDVVVNVGMLRSGMLTETEADLKAVVKEAHPLPVKVIIEIMVLTPQEIELVCQMCLRVGATFIKTGTGWAQRGTTVEDVRTIKAIVGDRAKIKASGGIRNLDTLAALYQAGARRFGVNLRSGIEIIEECVARGGVVEIPV